MNLGHTQAGMNPHAHDRDDTPLQGGRLMLARVGWIALTVLLLLLSIIAIPSADALFQSICQPDARCLSGQLSQDDLRLLHQLGLSPVFLATYQICLDVGTLLVYTALAALIFWRRSHDRMALFCAYCMVLTGSTTYTGLLDDGLRSASPAWFWLVGALGLLGQVSFAVFFLLFPSGRFVPRWSRWVVPLIVLNEMWYVFFVSPVDSGHTTLNSLLFAVQILTLVGMQIYRYRRVSTATERQQTKWVVFAFTLAITGFVLLIMIGNFLISPLALKSWVLNVLVEQTVSQGLLLLIPISIAISILRYRLWDIDIIINRTLVYGMLTASIIGLYILVVGYMGALFRTDNNLLISLMATGLVAVLFQPLRELLQRAINRLLYGQRDEPYTVITRLSQRLKGTLEPEAVLSTIVETVAQALKLPYAAILWKQEETFELTASYGKPTGEPVTIPLVYQAETVGQLQLAPRTPGEAFTPADARLLEELARQAGLAAHAVRLATDLQKARERLVLAREEERRRLRRDLHDGVGPTLASLSQRIDTACHLVSRDPDAAIVQLRNLKVQIKSTIGDIRRVVYALRPPVLDELGLISAIREHVLQRSEANGLHISIEAPADVPPLPAAVEVAAYRIILEALTNVERHAHAQHCLVRLELTDGRFLCLSIADDGRGLLYDHHAGVGIIAMRERVAELGGEFALAAKLGGGTHVRVRFPLKS